MESLCPSEVHSNKAMVKKQGCLVERTDSTMIRLILPEVKQTEAEHKTSRTSLTPTNLGKYKVTAIQLEGSTSLLPTRFAVTLCHSEHPNNAGTCAQVQK